MNLVTSNSNGKHSTNYLQQAARQISFIVDDVSSLSIEEQKKNNAVNLQRLDSLSKGLEVTMEMEELKKNCFG